MFFAHEGSQEKFLERIFRAPQAKILKKNFPKWNFFRKNGSIPNILVRIFFEKKLCVIFWANFFRKKIMCHFLGENIIMGRLFFCRFWCTVKKFGYCAPQAKKFFWAFFHWGFPSFSKKTLVCFFQCFFLKKTPCFVFFKKNMFFANSD